MGALRTYLSLATLEVDVLKAVLRVHQRCHLSRIVCLVDILVVKESVDLLQDDLIGRQSAGV